MPLYVLPLVKAAALAGCSFGVTDTLYQHLKKRKTIKAVDPPTRAWNADRTAKVAIGGLVAGPLIGAPIVWLQHFGLRQLFDVLGSVVVTELIFSPLVFLAGTDRTRYYKPFIPLALLGTGIGGVAAAGLISTALLHQPPFSELSLYGVYSPEAIVFTTALASAAFMYYSYSHQYAISYAAEVPYQRRLINASAWCGALSAAALLTMGVCDVATYTTLHRIATGTFIVGGSIHQLSLTYQMTLVSRERPLSGREAAVLKVRKGLNAANVLSLVGLIPCHFLLSSAALPIILQYSALATWALYVLTSYDDFILMPPEGSDEAVFTNYEKQKEAKEAEQREAERLAKEQEAKDLEAKELEAQQLAATQEAARDQDPESEPLATEDAATEEARPAPEA